MSTNSNTTNYLTAASKPITALLVVFASLVVFSAAAAATTTYTVDQASTDNPDQINSALLPVTHTFGDSSVTRSYDANDDQVVLDASTANSDDYALFYVDNDTDGEVEFQVEMNGYGSGFPTELSLWEYDGTDWVNVKEMQDDQDVTDFENTYGFDIDYQNKKVEIPVSGYDFVTTDKFKYRVVTSTDSYASGGDSWSGTDTSGSSFVYGTQPSSGDTVEIEDGTYEESVEVDISGITLGAADGATPTISPVSTKGRTDSVYISANDVTVRDLTVEATGGSTPRAIVLDGDDTSAIDNTVQHVPEKDGGPLLGAIGGAENVLIEDNTVIDGPLQYKGSGSVDFFGNIIKGEMVTEAFFAWSGTNPEITFEGNDFTQATAGQGADVKFDFPSATVNGEMTKAGIGSTVVESNQGVGTVEVDNLLFVGEGNNINSAVSTADSLGVETVRLESGTYQQSPTIDVQGLTLEGPNTGTHGMSDSRGDEAVVKQGLKVASDGVTVDGLRIENSGQDGVRFGPDTVPSDVMIQNNVITDVKGGTFQRWNGEAGAGNGIQFQFSDVDGEVAENIQILDNEISDVSTPDTKSRTTAIGINVLPKGNDVELEVEGNVIKGIEPGASSDAEERARAISVDTQDDNKNGYGRVDAVNITDNNITGLVSGDKIWAVSLFEDGSLDPREGVKNFQISENEFSNFDAPEEAAIFVGGYENLGSEHEVRYNAFEDGAVYRYNDSQDRFNPLEADALDARFNYWGQPQGPESNQVNHAVDYTPWLANGAHLETQIYRTNDSIQEAIDEAGDEDVVRVEEGYYSGFNVPKPVSVEAVEGHKPVVGEENPGEGDVIAVQSGGVTVEGLTIDSNNTAPVGVSVRDTSSDQTVELNQNMVREVQTAFQSRADVPAELKGNTITQAVVGVSTGGDGATRVVGNTIEVASTGEGIGAASAHDVIAGNEITVTDDYSSSDLNGNYASFGMPRAIQVYSDGARIEENNLNGFYSSPGDGSVQGIRTSEAPGKVEVLENEIEGFSGGLQLRHSSDAEGNLANVTGNTIQDVYYGIGAGSAVSEEPKTVGTVIEKNTIQAMVQGISGWKADDLLVKGNEIKVTGDEENYQERGIDISGNNVEIVGNEIESTNTSVLVESAAGQDVEVYQNQLLGETGVDAEAYTHTLSAERNYWGHPSGPSGDANGKGSAVYGDVTYIPWLPVPQAASGRLKVTPGKPVMNEGESKKFKAKFIGADGKTKKVTDEVSWGQTSETERDGNTFTATSRGTGKMTVKWSKNVADTWKDEVTIEVNSGGGTSSSGGGGGGAAAEASEEADEEAEDETENVEAEQPETPPGQQEDQQEEAGQEETGQEEGQETGQQEEETEEGPGGTGQQEQAGQEEEQGPQPPAGPTGLFAGAASGIGNLFQALGSFLPF